MPAKKGTPGRAISDANLKRTAAITHGAFSAAAVRPLRERFGTELAEAFPNASEAEVTIQAQRLAQLELLGGFLEERGVMRIAGAGRSIRP